MDADPFKTVELSPNSPAANGHVPYNEDIDKLKTIINSLGFSIWNDPVTQIHVTREQCASIVTLYAWHPGDLMSR